VQSIVSYGFASAERRFAELGLPLHSLVTYDDLLGELELDASQRTSLASWRQSQA